MNKKDKLLLDTIKDKNCSCIIFNLFVKEQTLSDLSKRFNKTISTIQYQVNKLKETDLIIKKKNILTINEKKLWFCCDLMFKLGILPYEINKTDIKRSLITLFSRQITYKNYKLSNDLLEEKISLYNFFFYYSYGNIISYTLKLNKILEEKLGIILTKEIKTYDKAKKSALNSLSKNNKLLIKETNRLKSKKRITKRDLDKLVENILKEQQKIISEQIKKSRLKP